MPLSSKQVTRLRTVINENLRVQRGGADPVPYIDVSSALSDVCTRQNHTVFGRRGCGKTLLLHHSSKGLPDTTKTVYLNCEDFKHHSFPNVLIEILDALFMELQTHQTGWFGKRRRTRELLQQIRAQLQQLREEEDELEAKIIESKNEKTETKDTVKGGLALKNFNLSADSDSRSSIASGVQRTFTERTRKITELDKWLPGLKQKIREFFALSNTVQAVFLQLDDFYHLARRDQPYVMDYLHRLCKDQSLYFKVATLRHASTLYADREGQPIGAQERHDYQPINIDFTLADFQKTRTQNRGILREFAKLAGLSPGDVDGLFKGEGFSRLIMAGGGVPRDCLSLFLEVLDNTPSDGRIGKDDVRVLSRSNFERRIEELKQDSEGSEQDTLIRGIYVLRKFCIDKKTNIMMVSEQMMQQEDRIRGLLNRLLDYRIIHSVGVAITHKSEPGTYQAFAIDIGCYAHMRKLEGRFNEIDLSQSDAREQMRSAPILTDEHFASLWALVPDDAEAALRAEDEEAGG